jgi:protein-disulfide isomerase
MASKKRRSKTPNIPEASAQPTASTKVPNSKRASQRERRRRRNQMLAGIAIAVVVLAVVGVIFVSNRSQAASAPPPTTESLPADMVARTSKGSQDAPVVVTVYSDFECPACKSFAEGAEKQLDKEYVETGEVLFEYKHYPLPQHEPGATWSANAAECAADQGKFWEMHDYLFQEQGKLGPNTFTQGRLRGMAEALGLDTGEFNSCFSSQEHAQVIQDDINEARQLFVNATPTVFVNGQKVNNPGYTDVKAAIDAALAAQGQG